MKNKLGHALASCLGVGYFPFASGTAGSFGTLPFAFAAIYWGGLPALLALAAVTFFIGTWATAQVLKTSANTDPSLVVVDEAVGQLLTFSLITGLLYQNLEHWYLYIIGFFLFRFFDIFKLGPAKWADTKLTNAWGVMLDDVFAGIYAAVTLYLIQKGISYAAF